MRTLESTPTWCVVWWGLIGLCLAGCQSGGLRRQGSWNAEEWSFGSALVLESGFTKPESQTYDTEFIRSVSARWRELLESWDDHTEKTGKVVLVFTLHANGRISDLTVKTNEVGEVLRLICAKAILDLAPYKPWPSEVREAVGKDHREITFTFFYEAAARKPRKAKNTATD